MAYRIEIHRAAQRQILSLHRDAQVEIAKAIDGLIDNPRPLNCKKLRESKLWRVRVGRYRVVYVVDDEHRLIMVVKVGIRHENTYKGV